jgi:hypothetical protein
MLRVRSGVDAKAHLSVVETEESSVGDSDAVRVAGEVLQDVFEAVSKLFQPELPRCGYFFMSL